ncbi:MAG TPA: uracil-DNA glycosylase [Blastocatellia bacterium]|nr:uracil-DNA glycosylase [Blastocatellia bacterium]
MSKKTVEDAVEIAAQLEEQLRFYRDIGVSDFGGARHNTKAALGADSGVCASPALATALDEVIAGESADNDDHPTNHPATQTTTARTKQAALFGDLALASEMSNSRSTGSSLPVLETRDASLEAIREDIGDCRRCKLHEHRKTIVFGEGNPAAKLFFIGEGPGAEEDATGRPFVGRAGQLLDKIIAAIGLRREDVYIANVVKCRPPGNRTPERDEVDTCEQFVYRQIAFVRPKVIVALGSPAFQCLMRTRESISRARGSWRDLNGVKVMPTFHPAFLLRSPDKKREVWDDMKKVRDYLNESGES